MTFDSKPQRFCQPLFQSLFQTVSPSPFRPLAAPSHGFPREVTATGSTLHNHGGGIPKIDVSEDMIRFRSCARSERTCARRDEEPADRAEGKRREPSKGCKSHADRCVGSHANGCPLFTVGHETLLHSISWPSVALLPSLLYSVFTAEHRRHYFTLH